MPRLFVDNLTVLDCSILDPKRGLIGASWAVDIELFGELDHQSMVFDFAKVKKTIKQVIDSVADHKLIIPLDYQNIEVTGEQELIVRFTDRKGSLIEHISPAAAVCLIPAERVSRKRLGAFLNQKIIQALPENVEKLDIKLRKEYGLGKFYTYSHGLKKHDGNCQRIAHGHRSTVSVWKNDRRHRKFERALAEEWADIYLGTAEDVTNFENGRVRFEYHTEQGRFALELDSERAYIMECDSTVECIAEHILARLQEEEPDAELKVKAFEGIGKGAIAHSN